jgi:mRNA interferase MazF
MITSAETLAWPGDHDLGSAYREAGLPTPSIIRTSKFATIETRRAEPIGRISPAMLRLVDQTIMRLLGG